MLISIHELTLTCKNSKKIALNSREVGVLDQSKRSLSGTVKFYCKNLLVVCWYAGHLVCWYGFRFPEIPEYYKLFSIVLSWLSLQLKLLYYIKNYSSVQINFKLYNRMYKSVN